VNAVQFSTNYGQTSLLAPASCDSASVATWSVPGNCTLIGFQGSSGDYLNQLQPVCLSFSPATWSSVSVSVDEILFPYTQCIAAMTFRSVEGVTNELDNLIFSSLLTKVASQLVNFHRIQPRRLCFTSGE